MLDLTGQRFHRLLVLRETARRPGWQRFWLCRCDCGVEKEISQYLLRCGNTHSCGCWRAERFGLANKAHGKSETVEYYLWTAMRQRCNNPNNPSYERYGGRGIYVCPRWNQFEHFLADMGERPGPSYSLERIDNNGPYGPDNVRWATVLEQQNNRSNNHRITFDGRTQTATEWEREAGLYHAAICSRAERGWTAEMAITLPAVPNPAHLLSYQGQTLSVAEWSKKLKINRATIEHRLRLGWPVERVLSSPLLRGPITFKGETKTLKQWANAIGLSSPTLCQRLRHGWPLERALTAPVRPNKRHRPPS